MSDAIGDLAIGDIEAAVASLAGCAPGGRARFIRKRIAKLFRRRRCAEVSKLVDVPSGTPINVLTVWRALKPEELVGEVRQSDEAVLIEATGFDGTSFPLPLKQGMRLVRWPGQTRERAMTIEFPSVETMSGLDIIHRAIVRG